MHDAQTQTAKEIGLLREWNQRFWGRRYDQQEKPFFAGIQAGPVIA